MAAHRGFREGRPNGALDVERAYRRKNQYQAAPKAALGSRDPFGFVSVGVRFIWRRILGGRFPDVKHEWDSTVRVRGSIRRPCYSPPSFGRRIVQRMWHLIEDFFEQGVVVKLFLAVGWLAVVIMVASLIDLLLF